MRISGHERHFRQQIAIDFECSGNYVWVQFQPLAVVDGGTEDTKDAKLELSLSVKGAVLR
jgi:hypothetical protein